MATPFMDTIKNDVSQLKNLNAQRKAFLFALVFVLFVVSVLVGAYLSRGSLEQKAQGPSVTRPARQTTTLTIDPAKKTMKVGETQEVVVKLGQLPVTAVDIVLTFDPEIFSVSNVKNGDVFDKVIRNTQEAGTITFSASVSPENATTTKEGTALSFTLRALTDAPTTTVSFDQDKTITALNGENTLGLTTGGVYTVTK